MINTISLRTGHKYTIYSSEPYLRKREVIFTKSIPEYRKSPTGRKVQVGHYRTKSSMELLLYIDPRTDLIVPGWGCADLVSKEEKQIIFEGGFGEGFSLVLQNVNPNFTAHNTLYFLDRIRNSEPRQLFPVITESKKSNLQIC